MRHKQTDATDIPKEVKDKVFERDEHMCVWCGRMNAYVMPEAHFIPRSKGGLGIEENILTLCRYTCHEKYDHGYRHNREEMRAYFREYLKSKYPDWDEKKLVYRR